MAAKKLGDDYSAGQLVFPTLIEDKDPVSMLARRKLKNIRSSTRKRAEKFIRRHEITPASYKGKGSRII